MEVEGMLFIGDIKYIVDMPLLDRMNDGCKLEHWAFKSLRNGVGLHRLNGKGAHDK